MPAFGVLVCGHCTELATCRSPGRASCKARESEDSCVKKRFILVILVNYESPCMASPSPLTCWYELSGLRVSFVPKSHRSENIQKNL